MFIVVWKFLVKPQHEIDFVRVYGESGDWVELFRKAPGYIRSELHCDVDTKHQYLTIDRWESEADYKKFRSVWASQYQAIDSKCEDWTQSETAIGEFRSSAQGGFA
jgi:heme-degrading monooxygenase HmoA